MPVTTTDHHTNAATILEIPLNTFNEIDLIEPVQRALADENYRTPTEIQARTIPAALEGFDVLGCAQTGTGKTAAFALPVLSALGSDRRRAVPGRPFALVLAPTRELAIQISKSFDAYGRHLPIRNTAVFGGVSQSGQVKSLRRGTHILVATPGRLLDLINQGHVNLDRLDTFVLDEVDRMLDMGFLPDLKRLIRCLPEERQSLFFSATLQPKIVELARQLLFEPVHVNVSPKSKHVNKITQRILITAPNEKQPKLQQILEGDGVRRAIVFTRTKRTANKLEKTLKHRGVDAAAIHSNKSQAARTRVLEAFRRDRVQVLVATDVAARGIDVDDITHVINYDLPDDPENYVHRIGRTGRAGAVGIAITFCTPDQRGDLRVIEKFIGKRLTPENGRDLPGSAGRRQRSRKSERERSSAPATSSRKRRAGGAKSRRSRRTRKSAIGQAV